jgi:hypothetical protein
MSSAILATGVAVQLSVSCAAVVCATLSADALAGGAPTRSAAVLEERVPLLAAPSQGRGDHAHYFTRATYKSWGPRASSNTDLGDAWEWAERPDYPLKYLPFACQMGVNAIVYAMSH